MKNKFSYYVLVVSLTICAVISLVVFIVTGRNLKSHDFTKQAETSYAQADKYNRLSNNLSTQKILDKIVDQNINVQNSLNDVSKKLNTGIDLVYNKTKNEQDYQHLKSSLPKLVGKELSDKLLELDKPSINQSGKSTVAYGKAEDTVIAFGRYNYKSTTVPIYIAVDYKTPTIATSGSAMDKDDKAMQLSGQDLFVCNYDLSSKKLTLTSYTKGDDINGQR